MRRIVLTGGPGAGKTVISAHLQSRDPRRFVLVPEAATQVYAGLGKRWDELDREGRRDVQRRIYRLQLRQEEQIARACPRHTLILDRGSVDGAAYWPDGPDDYWRSLGTTRAVELARYEAVIWMQSSAALGIYDGRISNPCRFEDAAGAIQTGGKLAQVWSGHPNFKELPAYHTIEMKIEAVAALVDAITSNPTASDL